jgi:hypothetical protein
MFWLLDFDVGLDGVADLALMAGWISLFDWCMCYIFSSWGLGFRWGFLYMSLSEMNGSHMQ